MGKIFNYFFYSRILFLAFAVLAIFFIPIQEGYLGKQISINLPYFIWDWANFDGRHYIDIAVNGYRNYNFAFFPFYPLLIKIFNSMVVVNPIYIGILISVVCLFISMIVIYKIVKLDYSKEIAFSTLFFISIFPLSFFYHSVYADSVFLLCSVSSFYFARKKKWLLCGIFGFLTTFARLAGLALLPALLVEWYLQEKKVDVKKLFFHFYRTNLIALHLTLLGFLSYLLYLQFAYQDFLLFQKAMIAWRQNEFVFPPQVIFRYLKIFFLLDKGLFVYWVALLEFVSMIVYFGLTFYVYKKVRFSYAVLMFFVFLLPTFTGTFAGMPRYILHTFPAFIGISLLLDKRPLLRFFVILIFIILGFIFTGLFTRGYFIA